MGLLRGCPARPPWAPRLPGQLDLLEDGLAVGEVQLGLLHDSAFGEVGGGAIAVVLALVVVTGFSVVTLAGFSTVVLALVVVTGFSAVVVTGLFAMVLSGVIAFVVSGVLTFVVGRLFVMPGRGAIALVGGVGVTMVVALDLGAFGDDSTDHVAAEKGDGQLAGSLVERLDRPGVLIAVLDPVVIGVCITGVVPCHELRPIAK